MRTVLIIFCALFLCGCDPVIGQTAVGSTYQRQGTESCSKSGFCRKCKTVYTRVDGGSKSRRECGYTYSTSCSGKRDVTKTYQRFERTYRSGKMSVGEELMDRKFTGVRK